MPNKTKIFTDTDISQITNIYNKIQESEGLSSVKIKDAASNNYVINGCELKRMEDFNTECWTLAVLARINDLGYVIKKRDDDA